MDDPDGASPYCGQCGEPGSHEQCLHRAVLEPPRFCPACRRRMVVQVTPRGWAARCVEHGTLTGGSQRPG